VELAKLIEFAWPGDTVCVFRLDRLARNLRHLLEIVDQLASEIGLTSLTKAIDTSTPSGRLRRTTPGPRRRTYRLHRKNDEARERFAELLEREVQALG